jgi:hypothetical protein
MVIHIIPFLRVALWRNHATRLQWDLSLKSGVPIPIVSYEYSTGSLPQGIDATLGDIMAQPLWDCDIKKRMGLVHEIPRDEGGKMDLARSDGSAWTTWSSSTSGISRASWRSHLPITITGERICPWRWMVQSHTLSTRGSVVG